MKQADLLTAAFRQLASAKAGAKGGLHNILQSKDGKEKAAHFREQMQQVSKDRVAVAPSTKQERPQIAQLVTSGLEAAAILAELAGDTAPKPLDDEKAEKDNDSSKPSSDIKQTSVTTSDWHESNAALSFVVSKLEHAHQAAGRDVKTDTVAQVYRAESNGGTELSEAIDVSIPADIDSLTTGSSSDKRFTAVVETMDTKSVVVASKPVVREQETHFEPVQQTTTLQKIVDRMAGDLPLAVKAEGPQIADTSQDMAKMAESRPVRMMTLELDPPNLGTVTIKMRLAGDAVEVHLAADRIETTNLLRQERAALSDAMQSAGYTFDIAAIDHTRTPDANLNNGQSQSQSQQQQAPSDQRSSMSSSGSQADGGASGRSFDDGKNGSRQNRHDHDQPQTSPDRQQDQDSRRIRSSTVYL